MVLRGKKSSVLTHLGAIEDEDLIVLESRE